MTMPTSSTMFRRNSRFGNTSQWLVIGLLVFFLVCFLVVFQAIRQLPQANVNLQADGLNQHEQYELGNILGNYASDNVLQVDLQHYADELSKIGWVEQVDVRRDWQKGVIINVTPRKPVAKFGSERLVDAHGVVFKPADQKELNTKYLMQLQGDEKDTITMMQHVNQVGDWYLPLGLKLKEVIVTSRMTWLFRFDNGLQVLVDNDDTSEKLYHLSVMLQHQLHSKLSKIQSIDLRYKNGMAVTWRPTDNVNIKS